MLKNNEYGYGSVSKSLHWLITILVITLLSIGFFMGDLSKGPTQNTVYMMHKATGLVVLSLMVLRLVWRWINPAPELSLNIPAWQRLSARALHYLFYVILIAMPLSGWIGSTAGGKPPTFYNLFTLPFPGIAENKALKEFCFQAHTILAWTIIAMISLHILAALKHHYIDQDNILKRMLPGSHNGSV